MTIRKTRSNNPSLRGGSSRRDSSSKAPGNAREFNTTSVVYGVNAVLEALRAGRRQIEGIMVLEGARPDRLRDLLDLARERRVLLGQPLDLSQ